MMERPTANIKTDITRTLEQEKNRKGCDSVPDSWIIKYLEITGINNKKTKSF
jgi:hypothetical protein